MSQTTDAGAVKRLLKEADLALAVGNRNAARVYLRNAVAADETGAALNALGVYQRQTGELEESVQTFEQLLILADHNHDPELRAVAANNLACLCRELGEQDIAASWQQQSWQAAQSNGVAAGTHLELGCDLSNRANDAMLAGDLDLAERLFKLALKWEEERGTSSRQGDDWGSLGLIAGLQGDLQLAMERLQQAARLHREAGDMRGVGCDLLNVAELCAVQQDWEPGLKICEEAQQILRNAGASDVLEHAATTYQVLKRGLLVSTFDATLN